MNGQAETASQLTFREKVDTCWQKQIRDQYLPEGTPNVPHLNVKKAVIKQVSRKLARQIIYKYEWLGTMATSSSHFYGIFFGLHCAGVTCVSVNSTGTGGVNAHCKFGIKRNEFNHLVRGACVHWAPIGCNSKL